MAHSPRAGFLHVVVAQVDVVPGKRDGYQKFDFISHQLLLLLVAKKPLRRRVDHRNRGRAVHDHNTLRRVLKERVEHLDMPHYFFGMFTVYCEHTIFLRRKGEWRKGGGEKD